MKEIDEKSTLEMNRKGEVELYFNSGYLNNSKLPFKDKSKPLIVGSCGTYRLRATRKLPTWNPRGRVVTVFMPVRDPFPACLPPM